MIRPHIISRPDLPQLAWVCCIKGQDAFIYHGVSVEVGADWIVEGAWDGEFSAGEFDSSENFFGSGVRFDRQGVHFVPSSALVDRLVYCRREGSLTVSNSLTLLLAYNGDSLDPAHDYRLESNASLTGIEDYHREFVVAGGQYEQLIFSGMTWDGDLKFWQRPLPAPLKDFADYDLRLRGTLVALAANYKDERRVRPMVGLTTVSSGYDSAAVASLVKDLGVQRCYTSKTSNSVLPLWLSRKAVDDSGVPVAEALDLDVRFLQPEDPPAGDDELYFLAGSCAGQESLFHRLASDVEESGLAVVFTGYHGDKVWDRDLADCYVTRTILRGDSSGLGLSEIRLKAGFINAPVPFIFARRVDDLVRISGSDEMTPWRVNRSYDRPIPRRIAETAGVPRGAFGQRKRAVWEQYYLPRSPRVRAMVFETAGAFVTPHHIIASASRRRLEIIASIVTARLRRVLPFPAIKATAGDDINLLSLSYVAANTILSRRYSEALPTDRPRMGPDVRCRGEKASKSLEGVGTIQG